jgi:ketosteroid isomerase-like protein
MKRMLLVLLACGLGVVAAAAAAEEGAKGLDAAWAKGMLAGDAAAVAACYAPDALLWLPDTPEAHGAKAIRDTYDGFLATWTVTDVTFPNAVYQTSGDLSAGWGNFTMTLKPKKGGDTVVMKGRYVDVGKKIADKWLYVADHASADPPPPAPATK